MTLANQSTNETQENIRRQYREIEKKKHELNRKIEEMKDELHKQLEQLQEECNHPNLVPEYDFRYCSDCGKTFRR
jgi:hypothetical protein